MQLTLEDLNRFTPEELIAICSVKWPGGYDRNELLRAGLAIYPVYRAARARGDRLLVEVCGRIHEIILRDDAPIF